MQVTFVPETGAGLSTATSYLTVDEFKQLWFDREYNYGALSDSDIERLLNKSTAYVDAKYSTLFNGYRAVDTQALSWPREASSYIIDPYEISDTVVPPEVKVATAEVAYLINNGEALSATISKSGKIKSTRVKVDTIEEEISYEEGSTLYSDVYPIVDQALSRITGGSATFNILKLYRVGGESPWQTSDQ